MLPLLAIIRTGSSLGHKKCCPTDTFCWFYLIDANNRPNVSPSNAKKKKNWGQQRRYSGADRADLKRKLRKKKETEQLNIFT